MKTLKTIVAILAITSITSVSFAKQGGLLNKAKEASKKKPIKTKIAKKNKKKNDRMAVKGSGVSTDKTTTTPAAAAPTK